MPHTRSLTGDPIEAPGLKGDPWGPNRGLGESKGGMGEPIGALAPNGGMGDPIGALAPKGPWRTHCSLETKSGHLGR